MANPPLNKVDNKELFRKSNRNIKKRPKYRESRSNEFKNANDDANKIEISVIPVYPRFIKASPTIPVLACCKGECKYIVAIKYAEP